MTPKALREAVLRMRSTNLELSMILAIHCLLPLVPVVVSGAVSRGRPTSRPARSPRSRAPPSARPPSPRRNALYRTAHEKAEEEKAAKEKEAADKKDGEKPPPPTSAVIDDSDMPAG